MIRKVGGEGIFFNGLPGYRRGLDALVYPGKRDVAYRSRSGPATRRAAQQRAERLAERLRQLGVDPD